MQKQIRYIANDGKIFLSEEECISYEEEIEKFKLLIESKIGPFFDKEIRIGGRGGCIKVTSLPFKAPWMTPFGAGLINIVDISRDSDNYVVFTIADEKLIPYKDKDGNEIKVRSHKFPCEYPQ